MKLGGTIILGALSLCVALVACGGDNETAPSGTTAGTASTGSGVTGPCNSDPFACAAGTTCWVSGTQESPTFECLPAGAGKVGEGCMNYIGTPTCADGMTCFSVSGYPNVCTPYCDPQDAAHGCPDGANCLQIQLQGWQSIYFACEPSKETTTSSATTSATGTGGAGGDGSGGSGGAGGA